MNILERTGLAESRTSTLIYQLIKRIWKLAYVRFVRFCFLICIIELKTQQDNAYLEQREQRTYEGRSFVTLGVMGPSWKVGSLMVCDGAQRDFFARKKPCPLQANSGFYHPPTLGGY